MFSSELVPIYLNDHLAGSTAGRELAWRAAGENRGTEFGDFLTNLASEIDEDRAQLKDVMARLEVPEDKLKVGAGWVTEKLGRLKLNGRLTEYSPLSRVLELEGLISAVNGKRALWKVLAISAPSEPRIADIDFTLLIARAEEQVRGLDSAHARASEIMLEAESAKPAEPA
jgi:hypothetical protein